MSRVDDILDIIDAGIQSSPEADMYADVAPTVGEGCVRCPDDVPGDGDLCHGCRAFLLGDSDLDPAAAGWSPGVDLPVDLDPVTLASFAGMCQRLVAEVNVVIEKFMEAFRPAVTAILEEFKESLARVDAPEHRKREQRLLDRRRRSHRRTNRW